MLKLNLVSDRRLIERIEKNDRAVLGDLFVKYEKLIYSQIQSHGGSLDDAKDILQECIIVLWQNVTKGNFELRSKLSTYMVAVAKNKWMVELRKRKRIVDDDPPDDLRDDNLLVIDQMVEDEELGRVKFALDKIQPICKQILMLFYFEERSMEDIAKMLHFSNMNVAKSKKYQCKKALQQVILQQLPEERRI